MLLLGKVALLKVLWNFPDTQTAGHFVLKGISCSFFPSNCYKISDSKQSTMGKNLNYRKCADKKKESRCSSDNWSSWCGCGKIILMVEKKGHRSAESCFTQPLEKANSRNQSHKIRSKQKNFFKHIKSLNLSHWISSSSHFNVAYPKWPFFMETASQMQKTRNRISLSSPGIIPQTSVNVHYRSTQKWDCMWQWEALTWLILCCTRSKQFLY